MALYTLSDALETRQQAKTANNFTISDKQRKCSLHAIGSLRNARMTAIWEGLVMCQIT